MTSLRDWYIHKEFLPVQTRIDTPAKYGPWVPPGIGPSVLHTATMEEPGLNKRKRSCKFGSSESSKQAAGRLLFRTAGWLACLETCRAGWRLDPGGMECRRIDPDSRYTENWNSTIACLSWSLPTCLLALSPTLSTPLFPLQFFLVILSLVGYRSVPWAN
jgi:hypothetical protein